MQNHTSTTGLEKFDKSNSNHNLTAIQKSEEYRRKKLADLLERKNKISSENFRAISARFCEQKIANISPDEIDNLFSKTIAHIVILRGIKSLPDDITFEGLKRALQYFNQLTFSEINIAFELDNMRLLGDRVNHFGLFSVEFFTDVLIKFRDFSDSIFHEYRMKFEVEKPKEFIPQPDSVHYDSLVKYVEEKQMVPTFWAWQNVYQHMKDSGMITESQKWKDDFIARVKRSFENEKQIKELNGFKFGSETLKERVRAEYVRHKMQEILNLKSHLSCE